MSGDREASAALNGSGGPATNEGAGGSDDLRSVIAGAVADEKKAQETPPPAREPSEPPSPKPGEGDEPGRPSRSPQEPPGRREPDEDEPKPAPGTERDKPPAADKTGREESPADAPPAHWSQTDKEDFAALPSAARGPFLKMYKRMEAGFTPKLMRGAQLEKDYGAADQQVFTADQRAIIAQKGSTIPEVINAWANVERALGGNDANLKHEIIARIIHGYGADPAAIAQRLNQLRGFPAVSGSDTAPNGATPPSGQTQSLPQARTGVDPALHNRLTALETAHQSAQTERQNLALREAGNTIQTFANEQDGEGQLKHPFFAELEAEMTALAQFERIQGRTPVLEDLYTRALWANQSTRDKQLALQRDAEAKRAADERKAKAEQAKRAASSVTGAPGPGQSATGAPELSLRDQIKANMAGGNQTSGGPGRI